MLLWLSKPRQVVNNKYFSTMLIRYALKFQPPEIFGQQFLKMALLVSSKKGKKKKINKLNNPNIMGFMQLSDYSNR